MPSAPSGALKKSDSFALQKIRSAVVATSFGPAIPGLFVYPQELTEMILPLMSVALLPVHVVVPFCTQGPPDDPPDSPQLPNHQLTVLFGTVLMSSAQYMNFGSTLYE